MSTPFQDPELQQDPVIQADRDETTEDIDKIQQLVRELGLTGGAARIFRQPPGGSDYNYEGEVPVDNFSLETIKETHGGGRYVVKLVASGGKFVKQIKFTIDPRYIGSLHQPKPTVSTTASDSYMARLDAQIERSERNARDHMTLMMGVMQANQQSMLQLVSAIVANKAPVNVTPAEPASRLLEVMTPLLLQQMTQPRTENGNDLSKLTDLVKLARELGGNPAPEDKEADMMDKLMKVLQVGAPLVGAFMSRGGQPTHPSQPVQVNPATRPIPTSEESQMSAAQAKMRGLLNTLKAVRPILIRAARKNSDIVSYLDILNDSLDDEGNQMLTMALQQENWLQILFDNDPDVTAHIGWFENFRQMILNPDDDEEKATPQNQGPNPSGTPGMVP